MQQADKQEALQTRDEAGRGTEHKDVVALTDEAGMRVPDQWDNNGIISDGYMGRKVRMVNERQRAGASPCRRKFMVRTSSNPGEL